MKSRFLLAAIVIVLSITSLWAARRAWSIEKRPPVSLGLAYESCLEDLRKRFPKDAHAFYCRSAVLQRTFTEADWEIRFSKEGAKSDGVAFSVGSDKSVRFAMGGFEH